MVGIIYQENIIYKKIVIKAQPVILLYDET